MLNSPGSASSAGVAPNGRSGAALTAGPSKSASMGHDTTKHRPVSGRARLPAPVRPRLPHAPAVSTGRGVSCLDGRLAPPRCPGQANSDEGTAVMAERVIYRYVPHRRTQARLAGATPGPVKVADQLPAGTMPDRFNAWLAV